MYFSQEAKSIKLYSSLHHSLVKIQDLRYFRQSHFIRSVSYTMFNNAHSRGGGSTKKCEDILEKIKTILAACFNIYEKIKQA